MRVLGTVLGSFATLAGAAILGDLVSEEVRGRLDRLPHALIRLASRRLPDDVWEDLAEDWTAELHEILRGAEALPVTRLYRGIRFGLGLLRTARRIGRDLSTTATPHAGATVSRVLDRLVDYFAVAGIAGTVVLQFFASDSSISSGIVGIVGSISIAAFHLIARFPPNDPDTDTARARNGHTRSPTAGPGRTWPDTHHDP